MEICGSFPEILQNWQSFHSSVYVYWRLLKNSPALTRSDTLEVGCFASMPRRIKFSRITILSDGASNHVLRNASRLDTTWDSHGYSYSNHKNMGILVDISSTNSMKSAWMSWNYRELGMPGVFRGPLPNHEKPLGQHSRTPVETAVFWQLTITISGLQAMWDGYCHNLHASEKKTINIFNISYILSGNILPK